MTIQVTIKNVYGNERIYPINQKAIWFTSLTNKKTLDRDEIEIIKKLGEPKKTYDPNYECGFLSTDSQDGEYLTLDYGKIKFTGSEKELYILEQVDLENDSSIIIKYGNESLNCETDLTKLIEIFGDGLAKHFGNKLDGAVVIFREKADDGIRLSIKNGKLIQFEYWSPC